MKHSERCAVFRISDLVFRISCLALLSVASTVRASEPMPLVEDDVDAIACVHIPEGCARVLFFRHERLLADRLLVDDMQWVIGPDAARPFELH